MPFLIVFMLFLGAWFTHVVSSIANHEFVLLLGGAICFPIGIIHGIGIWFGVW